MNRFWPHAVVQVSAMLVLTNLAGARGGPAVVLQYEFQAGEAPPGLLADSSGFAAALPLTIAGGLSFASDAPVSGDGHVFGGTSLVVGPQWSMAYNSALPTLKHELQNFTLEAWMKLSAEGTSAQCIISHVPLGSNCDGRGWIFGVSSDEQVLLAVGDQSPGFVGVTGTSQMAPGVWYHLAGSVDESTGILRVFVNGREEAAANFAGPIVYANAMVGFCGGGGPLTKTTYIGAHHVNLPSDAIFEEHLQFPLPEGTRIDRVRMLGTAATGDSGVGSIARDLDYWFCQVFIDAQPVPQTIQLPGGAMLCVAASGNGPFMPRWQVSDPSVVGGWVDLVDGPIIRDGETIGMVVGAASACASITPSALAAAWQTPVEFRCVVSNACGFIPSAPAAITALPPACPGDVNGDLLVGLADVAIITQNWMLAVPPAPPAADQNGNGTIGLGDIAIVTSNWATNCR